MADERLEYDPIIISKNSLININTEKNMGKLNDPKISFREHLFIDQRTRMYSSTTNTIVLFDLDSKKVIQEISFQKGYTHALTYLPKERNIQLTDYEDIDMYYGFKLPIKYVLITLIYRPEIQNLGDKVNKTIFELYKYSAEDRKLEKTDFRIEKNYDLNLTALSDCLTVRDKYILIDNETNFELYDIETGSIKLIEIKGYLPHNSPDGHIIFVDNDKRKTVINVWDMDKMEFKFDTIINLGSLDYYFFIKNILNVEGYRMFFIKNKTAYMLDINSKKNFKLRIIWDAANSWDKSSKDKVSIVKDRLSPRGDIDSVQYLGASKVLVFALDKRNMEDSENEDEEDDGYEIEKEPTRRYFILDVITQIFKEIKLEDDAFSIQLINTDLSIIEKKYVLDLNIDSIRKMNITDLFPFILDSQKKDMSNKFLSSFKSNIIPLDIKKIIASLI